MKINVNKLFIGLFVLFIITVFSIFLTNLLLKQQEENKNKTLITELNKNSIIYTRDYRLNNSLQVEKSNFYKEFNSKCIYDKPYGATSYHLPTKRVAQLNVDVFCISDENGNQYFNKLTKDIFPIEHNEIAGTDHKSTNLNYTNWSPDGSKLVVGKAYGSKIYFFDYITKQISVLNIGQKENTKINSVATWDPDNIHIYVSARYPENESTNIYKINTESFEINLFLEGVDVPQVSPTGNKMSFFNYEKQLFHIIDLQTKQIIKTLNFNEVDIEYKGWRNYTWSPDAMYILFTGIRSDPFTLCTSYQDGCVDTVFNMYSLEDNQLKTLKIIDESFTEPFYWISKPI